MSNYNWGYKQGQKMAKDMGLTSAPSQVSVKPHTRAPRSPAPQGYAKGGPAKKYAEGGKVKRYSDGDPGDHPYDEKNVRSIYGKHYDRMSEIERSNADTLSKSRKKWTKDEIREMAPHPGNKLKPEDGYAKGGPVKHSDAKQDKAMMARHNKLMHPGQKSKLAAGGPAKKNWIKGAIKNPGALHRDLGVPQGQKIPAKKLSAAAKKPGVVGRRARLAQTLKKMK